MTGPTRRRRVKADPCASAAIDATIAEIVRYPPADRMTLFAARMVQLRSDMAAANPRASKRALATRGHQIGLRILNAITAAAHREQQQVATKLESPTKENA